MTRVEAFVLAAAVADAGHSVQISIAIHENYVPRESCSVHVRSLRFEAVKLQELMRIGEQHGVELHLIGDDLRYIESAQTQRIGFHGQGRPQ